MTAEQMEKVLIAGGLLNPNTGSKIVYGVAGEDRLLEQWHALLPGIGMRVERLSFNESRCYPVA